MEPVRTRAVWLTVALVSKTKTAAAAGAGFRTEHLLQDHYEKYGRQFGDISKQQYLHLAQQLRDSKPGKDVLESKSRDGVIRYDKKRGYFGSYELDGTVRTFFVPPDGVRFFELEAR